MGVLFPHLVTLGVLYRPGVLAQGVGVFARDFVSLACADELKSVFDRVGLDLSRRNMNLTDVDDELWHDLSYNSGAIEVNPHV